MSWLAFICEPSRFLDLSTTECSPHTSWEFIIYLDYEYSIIRGTRKFTWTSLVSSFSAQLGIRGLYTLGRQLYVGCRWCTLAAVIIQLVGFDVTGGINCQV